ncbi:hypothetical protein TNCV_2866771 [Trichonephila clavipes]|nr:hypothetical protein TNCV_2866771 [Trichonephila clavipes]
MSLNVPCLLREISIFIDKNSDSGERRGVQGKTTSLTGDQGGRRKSDNYKRKRNVGLNESSMTGVNKTKKCRHEVTGCKRKTSTSRSGGPQRKRSKGPERQNPSYRHESRRQIPQEPEQEPRIGRSSRQTPRRGRGSRHQERQEISGRSASRRAASLEVLVGDVNDKRKY